MLSYLICLAILDFFCFSSRRRHTRCAVVTGFQTCALPICQRHRFPLAHRYELEAMREGDRPVQPGFDTHLNIGSAQLAAKDCVDLIAAFLRADCMRQELELQKTALLPATMQQRAETSR